MSEYLHQFDKLLSQFLQNNLKFVPGQAQNTSNRLTIYSQQPQFMDIAFQYILNCPKPQARPDQLHKIILVTSLIKDKFKFDFETLAHHKLQEYYDSVVRLCQFLKCDSYPVYTNLSLALAYLFFNISGTTQQSLSHFLQPFLPQTTQSVYLYNYYYKILEFLAAEIDNSKLVIDEQLRMQTRERLVKQQCEVLMGLNSHTAQAWEIEDIDKNHIIQCFGEWVILQYSSEVVNSLPEHFIMQKIFQFLKDARRTNETSYCLKSIILHIRNPQENKALFEFMGHKIIELMNFLLEIKDTEEEQTEQFLRIIAEFSYKAVDTFVLQFNPTVEQFLRQFIYFLGKKNLAVFDVLLQFWEDMADALKVHQQHNSLAPNIYLMFGDVYDAICARSKYSLALMQQLNIKAEHKIGDRSQEGEEVFKRREIVVDFFSKLANLRDKPAYVRWVYSKIQAIAQQEQSILWPYLEIYLYSLVDALKELEQHTPQIDLILNIYLELSAKPNIALPLIVKKTFLRIFRSLMSIKQKDSIFINKLFALTAGFFDTPLLLNTVERTFESGCQNNSTIMKQNISDMFQVLHIYPYREGIVRGVVLLLCQSQTLVNKHLEAVLDFIFQSMQTFQQKEWKQKVKEKDFMHSLSAAIKVLKNDANGQNYSHIIITFTKKIWPFVKERLLNPKGKKDHQDESPDLERLVKLLKYIMRYLKFQFSEFIHDLYSTVLLAFQTHPVCSYAYLIEVAITVYYNDPQYAEYFQGVYLSFCATLEQHMSQMEQIEKYSYLFDDFIGMNKRFFLYNASILLSSGQLPNLIELCTRAFLGCSTPRIAKAAYAFFETIFMVYWPIEFIEQYNQQIEGEYKFTRKAEDEGLYIELKKYLLLKLELILTKMIEHLNKLPTQTTREIILDALSSSIKAFPAENPLLWQKILLAIPSDILLATEKQRFCGYLGRMKSGEVEGMRRQMLLVKRYLSLINKRMANAQRRKNRTTLSS